MTTNVYLPNLIVTETIQLKDLNGNAVTPNSLTYDVKDETGQVVVAETVIALAGGETEVSVSVPANINTVGSDGRSARTITIYMTTDDGILVNYASYFIEALETLTVLYNTVQTYDEACLVAFDVGILLDGWDTATRASRVSALKTAYHRMKTLRFNQYAFATLRNKTEDEFRATTADFQKSMRRAQLVEANLILNGDTIHLKQQQGILSETIGESSMFFRTTPPLNEPLSKQAMNELRGHIDRSVIIGRG